MPFQAKRFSRLFLLVAVVAPSCCLYIWEPWKAPRFRRTATTAYNSISANLIREIELSQNEGWNGNYLAIRDDEVVMSLTIGKDSGFIFESFVSGGSYDRNYGRVEINQNTIHLIPEYESLYLQPRLIGLQKGSWKFLVGAEELQAFEDSELLGETWLAKEKCEFLIRTGGTDITD